jgi:hypothetical protein
MSDDVIGEKLNSLLVCAQKDPTVKQEAVKITIEAIHQIGEQLKETRQIKQFQKLQKLMVTHWLELKKLTLIKSTKKVIN